MHNKFINTFDASSMQSLKMWQRLKAGWLRFLEPGVQQMIRESQQQAGVLASSAQSAQKTSDKVSDKFLDSIIKTNSMDETDYKIAKELQDLRGLMREIKLLALTMGAPKAKSIPHGLAHIIRLCIDAGITDHLEKLSETSYSTLPSSEEIEAAELADLELATEFTPAISRERIKAIIKAAALIRAKHSMNTLTTKNPQDVVALALQEAKISLARR